MRWKILIPVVLSTVTLLVGADLALAAPASAGPGGQQNEDGWCDPGEACLYFNSNWSGAVYDTTANVAQYDIPLPRTFKVSMNSPSVATQNYQGAGISVWNNAASAINRSSSLCFYVFYNSHFNSSYAYQKIWPGQAVNLDQTMKNNNASQALAPC